ncbi:transporter substrate-binding domain-containing protein [Rhizobium sp. rho-1.1]|uniref:transporter substrate-binding domain-containing protein n=1 Tax=Rhizobium sp. rho-1.1 TaxID=2506429 RepID=UPI001160851B|nr:transporter substrate-binding domain-containing protein [Rhizobium sp. rho-1.1]TQY10595.1 transporter substrate-binding domain-containing protein [Rhizobium sp. rho-1.1]
MKRQLIALALAAAAAFSTHAPASAADLELLQPGKLLVATEGTFPPFSMRGADGSLDGLEIRVMKEISKRLGLEYTPVIIKWESLLIGLQADQYDITSDAMDITPERQKQVVFADGWLESGAAVVVAKGSAIKTPADLKGKSVGALASSTFAKLAEDKGATVKAYKAETDGIQDLLNGNIDAEITDAIGAGYMIKSAKMPLEVLPEAISHIQKGFAVKKGKPELVKAVNKALAEMVADGTYAKLTTDLVGFDPAPKNPIRTIQ